MTELINKILEQNPNASKDDYAKEFEMLYGAFWVANEINDTIKDEIFFVESERIKHINEYDEIEIKPTDLVIRYSGISYSLAKQHCNTGKVFTIAHLMKDVFLEVVQTYLTESQRKELRKTISETILDFGYASGNNLATSFRIAPLIRFKNK